MVAEPPQKKPAPDFRSGDTVRIHIKVVEGDSERLQIFEGTVISRRGSGDSQSFTVRKISFGVGVERTFPLNSPQIERIEVAKTGRVRRSRLYYLRNLSGRAARLGEGEVRGSKEPTTKTGPASSAAALPKPESSSDGAAPAKAKPGETPQEHPKRSEASALGAAASK